MSKSKKAPHWKAVAIINGTEPAFYKLGRRRTYEEAKAMLMLLADYPGRYIVIKAKNRPKGATR